MDTKMLEGFGFTLIHGDGGEVHVDSVWLRRWKKVGSLKCRQYECW